MAERSKKQYLIDMHKWRSIVALVASIITLVASIAAITVSEANSVRSGESASLTFRYFTTLGNMLTALATSFTIPFAIEGIRKKRFVLPGWLSMLFYSGAICTTLIFVFAMVFILPYSSHSALGGPNFYLHVICPITVLLSFMLVENQIGFSRKDALICLTPFALYSLVYLVMVVFVGEGRGGWDDLYMLNTFVPAWLSFPLMWLLALGVAYVIAKASEKVNLVRREKMFAEWADDAEPVEVNIEVFGLGRYYGLRGTRAELDVPFDILEILAEKYSLPIEGLVKIYTVGLIEGMNDRERIEAGRREDRKKKG